LTLVRDQAKETSRQRAELEAMMLKQQPVSALDNPEQ
jgi:hypothetical protein